MNDRDLKSRILQAEGFTSLGMLSEAWEVIEDLPPKEKTSEPVLRIRLQVLTGLSKWELGAHIASVLLSGDQESRKVVSRFFLARGRGLAREEDYDGMRAEIRKAVDAWEDVRTELSDDDLNALCEN